MKLGLEKGLEKAALKLANLTFAIEIVPKPIFKLMIYKKVWNKIHTTFFSLLLNEFSPHFLPNQKEACVVFTKSRNYIGYIRKASHIHEGPVTYYEIKIVGIPPPPLFPYTKIEGFGDFHPPLLVMM